MNTEWIKIGPDRTKLGNRYLTEKSGTAADSACVRTSMVRLFGWEDCKYDKAPNDQKNRNPPDNSDRIFSKNNDGSASHRNRAYEFG